MPVDENLATGQPLRADERTVGAWEATGAVGPRPQPRARFGQESMPTPDEKARSEALSSHWSSVSSPTRLDRDQSLEASGTDTPFLSFATETPGGCENE